MKYVNSRVNFINERSENRLLELLLEANFKFTDDFNDVIGVIISDGDFKVAKIASMFRFLKNRDIDTPMNYIHIGDSNGTVKFLNSKKADEMFDEINKDKSIYATQEIMLKDKAPNSKNSIKIGRLIRKLIEIYDYKLNKDSGFTDKDIEDFVNLYKSTYDSLNNMADNFKILHGTEIAEAYDCMNYWDGNKGVLGQSCMKDVDQSFFEFYWSNENIKLLTLIIPSEDNSLLGKGVMGRSLLWDLSDGEIFMDRIYTARDSDEKLFIKYAKENGFIYKATQDYSEGPFFNPSNNYDEAEFLDLEVDVDDDKDRDIERFPYLDTMKYFYWKTGKLTNTAGPNGYIELGDTEGSYLCGECDKAGTITCSDCDGWGYENCTNCAGEGHYDCSRCEGTGWEECSDCEGGGYPTCPECEGEGEIDGEICDHCGGEQTIACQGCGGSGEESCDRCHGDGSNDCEECEARGKTECETCGGEGEYECERCKGYS